MANKQYTSIIRLFEHCAVSTGGDFNLSRVKKQLQAEFNIAGDGFIKTGGHTYTKQEVLEELERPDFLQRLKFHTQIWNSPCLLQFLETNRCDLLCLTNELTAFRGDNDFDAFISPYFAGPFNHYSRSLFSANNMQALGDLFAVEKFLQPAERDEAFRSLRIYLDDTARVLRNITKDNYKIMRVKIAHLIDQDWYPFFNNLPDECYPARIEIVRRLVNIGVAIQKTRRRDCRKMSGQLVKVLDLPEELHSVIFSNHKIYSSFRYTFKGRGYWVLVWIVFMFLRGVTSEGCNDSSRSTREYSIPDNIKYQVQDTASTLYKLLHDSTHRLNQDRIIIK